MATDVCLVLWRASIQQVCVTVGVGGHKEGERQDGRAQGRGFSRI